MSVARRFIALLLLTLWGPAMMHCRIEASGLVSGSGCCSEEKAAPRDLTCEDDSCETAEGAFTASSTAAAPAPHLLVSFESLAAMPPALVVAAAPPLRGVIESAAAPPEIAPTWVFRSRAALPARAPSPAS
ncbi:MAG: hypothetical protein V4773_04120 [Verrucomicrobiota bacterium]